MPRSFSYFTAILSGPGNKETKSNWPKKRLLIQVFPELSFRGRFSNFALPPFTGTLTVIVSLKKKKNEDKVRASNL